MRTILHAIVDAAVAADADAAGVLSCVCVDRVPNVAWDVGHVECLRAYATDGQTVLALHALPPDAWPSGPLIITPAGIAAIRDMLRRLKKRKVEVLREDLRVEVQASDVPGKRVLVLDCGRHDELCVAALLPATTNGDGELVEPTPPNIDSVAAPAHELLSGAPARRRVDLATLAQVTEQLGEVVTTLWHRGELVYLLGGRLDADRVYDWAALTTYPLPDETPIALRPFLWMAP